MESYPNVFIGFVDLLGFNKIETKLKKHGNSASQSIITSIFSFLDQITDRYTASYTDVTWLRYGDSYVCYSHNNNILHLRKMIENSCELIALALNNTIPLRLVIIQEDINIDAPNKGKITVSGSGWDNLMKLEKCLDWMGGVLYLPRYDGTHFPTVKKLVQTTYLVIQQNHGIEGQHFKAPFKVGMELDSKRTWFLNWYRCFHLPKEKQDEQINNWWQRYVQDHKVNDDEDVKSKQENSKTFGYYCRMLYQAAYLVHFSEIDSNSVARGEI